ncbi:MAG: hypothetical protein ABIH48_02915 [Candidatus Falkowbacteria bacterium]
MDEELIQQLLTEYLNNQQDPGIIWENTQPEMSMDELEQILGAYRKPKPKPTDFNMGDVTEDQLAEYLQSMLSQ